MLLGVQTTEATTAELGARACRKQERWWGDRDRLAVDVLVACHAAHDSEPPATKSARVRTRAATWRARRPSAAGVRQESASSEPRPALVAPGADEHPETVAPLAALEQQLAALVARVEKLPESEPRRRGLRKR
jgi:hypothetical protein